MVVCAKWGWLVGWWPGLPCLALPCLPRTYTTWDHFTQRKTEAPTLPRLGDGRADTSSDSLRLKGRDRECVQCVACDRNKVANLCQLSSGRIPRLGDWDPPEVPLPLPPSPPLSPGPPPSQPPPPPVSVSPCFCLFSFFVFSLFLSFLIS